MKQKRWVSLLLKAGVSLVILFLLYRKCDWQALYTTLRAANGLWFTAACLAAFIAYVVAAWRWQVLCPKASFGALFSIIFVSRLYSTILPGQVFGEASKILYISRWNRGEADISYEEGAAGVIVDKIIGLLSLLLLGIVAYLLTSVQSAGITSGFVVLIALLLCMVLLPAFPPVCRLFGTLCAKLAKRFPKLARMLDKLESMLRYWQSYLRKPLTLLGSLALGLLFQLLSVLVVMFCGLALGISVPLLDWCWIVAVLSLAVFIPISFAGLGVREATLVGLLAIFGVTADTALGCSILLLALQLLEALAGAILLGLQKRRRKEAPITAGDDSR